MRLVSFHPHTRPTSPAPRGRPTGAALAMALAFLAGLPGEATAAEPAPSASSPAARAGADPAIDRDFAALAAAPDEASAGRARERIEGRWQASGSATADLLTGRAAAAAHAGQRGLALDLLDAAILLAPDWAGGRHRRALLHLSGHDMARATDDLAAALRLEPRHFRAMAVLASILSTGERKPEALKLLRRIAEIDPRSPGLAAHIERLTLEVEGREL